MKRYFEPICFLNSFSEMTEMFFKQLSSIHILFYVFVHSKKLKYKSTYLFFSHPHICPCYLGEGRQENISFRVSAGIFPKSFLSNRARLSSGNDKVVITWVSADWTNPGSLVLQNSQMPWNIRTEIEFAAKCSFSLEATIFNFH